MSQPEYDIEISARRDTIWIHSYEDGSTVGRFSKLGVDIHNTVTEQMAGKSQCRLCTHGHATMDDWNLFREKAKEFWGLDIPLNAFDVSLLAKPAVSMEDVGMSP